MACRVLNFCSCDSKPLAANEILNCPRYNIKSLSHKEINGAHVLAFKNQNYHQIETFVRFLCKVHTDSILALSKKPSPGSLTDLAQPTPAARSLKLLTTLYEI